MIKKSLSTGTIVGLFLSLVTLCPVFIMLQVLDVLPFVVLPFMALGWQWGLVLEFAVFSVFAGLGIVVLLVGSLAAAWRTRAVTFKSGLQAGMLSGLATACVFYGLVVAPTLAVWTSRDLLRYTFSFQPAPLAEDRLLAFAQQTMFQFNDLIVTVLVLVAWGGLLGGLLGHLRRKLPPQPGPASLLEAIQDKRGRRAWFAAYDDELVKAGLLAGLIAGAIWMLSGVWGFWAVGDLLGGPLAASGPLRVVALMAESLRQSMEGTLLGKVASSGLSALLSPLLFLTVIGVGGLAAFLPKNPSSRLSARVYAAALAGLVAGSLASLQDAEEWRFVIGAWPHVASLVMQEHQPEFEQARPIMLFLSAARVRVAGMYLVWLPVLLVTAVAWSLWGALQGVLYGFIQTLLRLRPVDRARRVCFGILQQPDQFLLRLYKLFRTDAHAVQVLEHMAFDLKPDEDKTRVVAAYHVLAQQPGRAVEALELISHTLEQQPAWKLGAEIGALHEVLAHGLRASTVSHIAAIVPLPEERTSSLHPLLVKAGEHLTRIVNELKKIERVDDLGSKIIFLNNTLEHLRLAQLFLDEGTRAMCTKGCLALPEFKAFALLVNHWDAIVLSAVKDMQGRAELTAELKTRKLTFAPRLTLSLVLANQGLNVAEDVRLQVNAYQGEYEVVSDGEQRIDILSPQDSRELSFVIRPYNAGRLRVCWTITYDDALNDDRVLEFGDLVEFVEAEKPFQRIFPIPYVTGTPLQSGEMFVGRQDVFDFVREHLLGTYQNNVIVLHGQRRTGKTSVLYRLGDVLADTHVCVLIDMQGKAARGEVDFLYSIADDIAYTLENQAIAVELPGRKEFEESPEFFFRSRFLRGVYAALGGRSLLLMFDEFEELQKRVEDGKLTADIFPYLRNLMQHERKLDFVFTGTHKLEELAAEYWSILFNIAAYKRITFLAYSEVARLVTQPVAAHGLEYDPLAVERIYQVAAGHPYFTQVVCHELVAYHNETQRNYLTTTDVEASLDRIIERGEAHFKYIWAESTTQQRLSLLALAELLESKDAATPDDVCGLLHKRGRPLEEQALAQALAELESRDILMRSDPRSSLYRFRVDLIRRWIYASRPAYEKVV